MNGWNGCSTPLRPAACVSTADGAFYSRREESSVSAMRCSSIAFRAARVIIEVARTVAASPTAMSTQYSMPRGGETPDASLATSPMILP